MPALPTPMLRYATGVPTRVGLRGSQRRWAQVHDVRFLTNHQETAQKVLDKYKTKLDQKAKSCVDLTELWCWSNH